ncbi:secretion protein, HlyD family [Sulfurimonas gotlandica GD1]|jgi:cobalt-zinc-cadmium efflux system membrane fusion protein|uniref:Secretion protein, HlyD family n=1 Tax=Sulfurimonas gotlandica (strain DSM 19862 / JCM 16533 / GD1) TaxID=929558 RepID=B6BGI6_SULGG|nr:efflux RND transporter periplasmic adaptor subunit [Sulfurimonas gotlandica]EDZ63552.1 putative membrane-fusion protein [Sulfurimonas gotlandica GD1]EHP29614.1 secretion protein, HlyD family [Sulfurimonas gotlandica GD1]
MNKMFLLTITLTLTLFAVEIPTKHSVQRAFGKSVELNAQIVQLSNASQSVMSLVGGHIEEYYVRVGQSVIEGQKIVLIESIMLSNMTANFISQKKQLQAQEKNYQASKSLYEKGMTSMQELNSQSIKRDEAEAKLTSLKSQLDTLGINTETLKKASSNFILYAHSEGVVSEILQPLHSSIKEDTHIISVIKSQAFYLKSFLPLEYASKVKIGQKIVIKTNAKNIVSNVTQILPNVDEKTQRIVLLSSIDEITDNLYINAYTSSTLYFNSTKKYVAVEKSALSFFNNKWVVFVPKEEEKHKEHEGHDEHGEEKHEAEYEARVINIVTQDEEFAAVEGLELDEEYVSDKSYYVKSQLLKSSLGGHGH